MKRLMSARKREAKVYALLDWLKREGITPMDAVPVLGEALVALVVWLARQNELDANEGMRVVLDELAERATSLQ